MTSPVFSHFTVLQDLAEEWCMRKSDYVMEKIQRDYASIRHIFRMVCYELLTLQTC